MGIAKDINTELQWMELLKDSRPAGTFERRLLEAAKAGNETMLKRLEVGFPALVRAERARRNEKYWGGNMTEYEKAKEILKRICDKCQSNNNCSICRLYQFDKALEYCLLDGMTPGEAIEKTEKEAEQTLRDINEKYDRDNFIFF